jgi:hypothetical protein
MSSTNTVQVITPSKFLHEYKTDDNFAKEPKPELSLYLPDCLVGAVSGAKFNVKGKDVSKGKLGNSFSMSHEMAFKAHTPDAAAQWWGIISEAAGQVTSEQPTSSVPTSPVTDKESRQPASLQTEGLEKTETAATGTPATAAPASAAPETAASTIAEPASAVPASGVARAPGEY